MGPGEVTSNIVDAGIVASTMTVRRGPASVPGSGAAASAGASGGGPIGSTGSRAAVVSPGGGSGRPVATVSGAVGCQVRRGPADAGRREPGQAARADARWFGPQHALPKLIDAGGIRERLHGHDGLAARGRVSCCPHDAKNALRSRNSHWTSLAAADMFIFCSIRSAIRNHKSDYAAALCFPG